MASAVNSLWARFAKSTLCPSRDCMNWNACNSHFMEIKNLAWLFPMNYFPFLCKLWLKTILFSDDSNSVPNKYHYECAIFVWYESSERSVLQCIHVSYVGWSHWFSNELQSNNCYMSGFLHIIYAIPNASIILKRNEMCLEKNEKRPERNETCLARDETRGGNLLLSSSVCSPCKENQKANQKTAASKSMHVVTLFQAYKESAKSEHFFNISFKSSF